ncbi:MAG: hypothetical protein WBA57_08255, partial [Elainellaceae cyanobacterium]
MATPTPLTHQQQFGEAHAWQSLRQAIATSSGFQSWRQQGIEEGIDRGDSEINIADLSTENADQLVTQYLRETL